MPLYAARSPDVFPAPFRSLLLTILQDRFAIKEPKTFNLFSSVSEGVAGREHRRFRAFRQCLLRYPLHPLHEVFDYFSLRAYLQYGTTSGFWQVQVRVAPLLTTCPAIFSALNPEKEELVKKNFKTY